jgi:hypothetical protein
VLTPVAPVALLDELEPDPLALELLDEPELDPLELELLEEPEPEPLDPDEPLDPELPPPDESEPFASAMLSVVNEGIAYAPSAKAPRRVSARRRDKTKSFSLLISVSFRYLASSEDILRQEYRTIFMAEWTMV